MINCFMYEGELKSSKTDKDILMVCDSMKFIF